MDAVNCTVSNDHQIFELLVFPEKLLGNVYAKRPKSISICFISPNLKCKCGKRIFLFRETNLFSLNHDSPNIC